MKVNVGCGRAACAGWVNIDKSLNIYLSKLPRARRLLYRLGLISRETYEAEWKGAYMRRDVTRGIPFAQGSIDFIYASHLIEHLRQDQAIAFLRECFRVLKMGGTLRLVVPDLCAIARRYTMSASAHSEGGADCLADIFLNGLGVFESKNVTLLERVFGKGNWHLWMYDEESLTHRLKTVGFPEMEILSFRKGRTPDLDVIEVRETDSIYVEARK